MRRLEVRLNALEKSNKHAETMAAETHTKYHFMPCVPDMIIDDLPRADLLDRELIQIQAAISLSVSVVLALIKLKQLIDRKYRAVVNDKTASDDDMHAYYSYNPGTDVNFVLDIKHKMMWKRYVFLVIIGVVMLWSLAMAFGTVIMCFQIHLISGASLVSLT